MQIINDRTCILTRKKYKPEFLIRITKINGITKIDPDRKLDGKGYYIAKDTVFNEDTIRKLKKILKTNLDNIFIESLKKELEKYGS